jgi:hypothetical protein
MKNTTKTIYSELLVYYLALFGTAPDSQQNQRSCAKRY